MTVLWEKNNWYSTVSYLSKHRLFCIHHYRSLQSLMSSKFYVFKTDLNFQTTVLHSHSVNKAAACPATVYTIQASKGFFHYFISYLSCTAMENIQCLQTVYQQKIEKKTDSFPTGCITTTSRHLLRQSRLQDYTYVSEYSEARTRLLEKLRRLLKEGDASPVYT